MDAASYDHWYQTPRGQWIGRREATLVLECLRPRPGESLLDVGCGTGFFTRTLAGFIDGEVAGIDINPEWVEYARGGDRGRVSYEVADARALPYANRSFDLVVSIAALCFIEDEVAAIREILRVARRRFAIGLLNRRSLLWLQKGRDGGRGGYRGARWHTAGEAQRLFADLSAQRLRVSTAIHIPSSGRFARFVERMWPTSFASGAFILVCGDVTEPANVPPNNGMQPATFVRS
jgi:SAM-dependent methyltransferase